jgi:predicted component of type VI protein secretion system
MPTLLISREGFPRRYLIRLDRPDCTIGRSKDCNLQLLAAAVSRSHARLWLEEPGGWRVCDLGSSNGIALGGAPVPEGRGLALPEACDLRIGPIDLRFDPALEDPPMTEEERASTSISKLGEEPGQDRITVDGDAISSAFVDALDALDDSADPETMALALKDALKGDAGRS